MSFYNRPKGKIFNVTLACLLALAFIFSAYVANYGNHVGDRYISHDITNQFKNSDVFTRETISGTQTQYEESPEKWILRFKLYSVDPDELLNLIALQRARTSEPLGDPKFYSYGGAYLYPLGGYFYVLSRLNVIDTALTADKNRDFKDVYRYGRLLVLVFFISTLGVLCVSLKNNLILPSSALLFFVSVATSPAIFIFSITLKPHAWALSFYLLALSAALKPYLTRSNVALIGALSGLSIGSAITFAPILITYGFVNSSFSSLRRLLSPLFLGSAAVTFISTNPYLFLNTVSRTDEIDKQLSWFSSEGVIGVVKFIQLNLIPGIGPVATYCMLLMLLVSVFLRIRPIIIFILFFLLLFLFWGFATGKLSDMSINSRYVLYLVPLSIIIFLRHFNPNRLFRILLYFAVTIQFIYYAGFYIRYLDDLNIATSTRGEMAKYIEERVKSGSRICYSNIAPYAFPPISFYNYEIVNSNCEYYVGIRRDIVKSSAPSSLWHEDYELIYSSNPRGFIFPFGFQYGYVNPPFDLYKKIN